MHGNDTVTHEPTDIADWLKWLKGVAFSMKPGRPWDQDDLVQEGWLAMWLAMSEFDSSHGMALESWLKQKARWAMKEALRNGRLRDLPLFIDEGWGETLLTGFIDEGFEAVELSSLVEGYKCLSDHEKAFVYLRFYEGLTYANMAPYFDEDPYKLGWHQRMWSSIKEKLRGSYGTA